MRSVALLACLTAACAKPAPAPGGAAAPPVRIDGSSTVHPILKNVATRYRKISASPIEVAHSSTGAGFQKFCRGSIEVAGASRPISSREMKECAAGGVEFVELPIAFDGIAVVVHRDNDWAKSLTVAELKKLWEPSAQMKITRWKHLRAEWPDVPIHLVGPDPASGTLDYFTKAIVGQEGECRRDYFASDEDDDLVEAVARDGLALGYFGFSYYKKNRERLRAVAIDDGVAQNGAGAIEPTLENIRDARYQPLSRPLFLYVNAGSLSKRAVDDFVRFHLDAAPTAVSESGYVALPRRALDLVAARLYKRQRGSSFIGGGSELGLNIESLIGAYTVEVSTTRH